MAERFLVADDHPLFREALRLAICSEFPTAYVAETGSIRGARRILTASEEFDLAFLDLSLPGTNGVQGLIELRALFPKQPILIVSAIDNPQIIDAAMKCGAIGYIPKSARRDYFVAAIRTALSGEVTLPDNYNAMQTDSNRCCDLALAAKLATLTQHQARVLRMLKEGKMNKQIAHELDIGETTVKAHVSEILRKLAVASRTQAVILASKLGY